MRPQINIQRGFGSTVQIQQGMQGPVGSRDTTSPPTLTSTCWTSVRAKKILRSRRTTWSGTTRQEISLMINPPDSVTTPPLSSGVTAGDCCPPPA